MDSDDEFWKDKLTEIIAAGAGGAAGVLGYPALGAAAAFSAPAFIMVRYAVKRRSQRLRSGYDSMAAEQDATASSKPRSATHRTDSAGVQDVYLEAFRRVQEALDPEAMFALGRLMWIYECDLNRGPDWFFRGMSRLLSDLEVGELEQLQRIVSSCVAVSPAASRGSLDVVVSGLSRDTVEILGASTLTRIESVPSAVRLVRMLKQNGLAEDRIEPPHNFVFDAAGGPQPPVAEMAIRPDTAVHIVRAIGASDRGCVGVSVSRR